MRIPSGVTDQYIYFVAVDATDLKTRETGLSSFTVYRSRNGGAAAAFTTPTINEVDATNMPGVYELLLDEDMTIDAGNDSEEVCLHITASGMAPVTRTFELYRPKITAGNTLGVESDGDLTKVNTLDGHTPQTGDAYARLGAPAGASIAADIATVDTVADAIKLKTDNLPASPAATSDIPTEAEIADAVWDESTTGHTTAGTFGAQLKTVLDAVKAKTDQLTFTIANKVDASIQAAGDFAQAAADKIWSSTTRTLSAFGFSVTVGTNNDKTGYSLSSAAIQAVWDALTSALSTANSIGKLLVDNINATISSRAPESGGNVASIKTVTDKLDDTLEDDGGTNRFTQNALEQAPTGGAAPSAADIRSEIDNNSTQLAAIKAKTDLIPASPAATGDIPSAASIRSEIDSNSTQLAAIKTQTDKLPSGIKKNAALNNFEFLMVDSADHVTPKTGLTVAATRSIDGGSFAACANSVTEVGNGVYKINLAAADLNGDVITLKFSATGADTRIITIKTNT